MAGRLLCCFSFLRCGSGSRGRSPRTGIRGLSKERKGGLDQKGAECGTGWPKEEWAGVRSGQFTAPRGVDDCTCGLAVQDRQIRAALRRPLLHERCCFVRRCAAAGRPGEFGAGPGREFCCGRFRHHRALRAAAFHRVHCLRARSHGQRRYRRKNYEQTRDEFGELPHACGSIIAKAGTGGL